MAVEMIGGPRLSEPLLATGERMAHWNAKVTQVAHRTNPGTQQMGGRMDRP